MAADESADGVRALSRWASGVEFDAMPEAVGKRLPETGLVQHVAGDAVELRAEHPGPRRVDRRIRQPRPE